MEWYKKHPSEVSDPKIQRDPEAQAWGKMAECAFCLWAGIDIEKLKWDVEGGPDKGNDIIWYSLRFDVKHTVHVHGHLIWSTFKRKLFQNKQFDILVLVRGKDKFEIAGWCWKSEFRVNHYEIGTDPKQDAKWPRKLFPGTWIYTGKLRPMDTISADAIDPLPRWRQGVVSFMTAEDWNVKL